MNKSDKTTNAAGHHPESSDNDHGPNMTWCRRCNALFGTAEWERPCSGNINVTGQPNDPAPHIPAAPLSAVESIRHLPIMDKNRMQFTYAMALAALDQGANALADLAKRLDAALATVSIVRGEGTPSDRDCVDEIVRLQIRAESAEAALKRALNDAEVIGNVTAALLDLNATYFGNQVTFTFESTNDAMSYIHKARRIVTERLERIQRELDGKGE